MFVYVFIAVTSIIAVNGYVHSHQGDRKMVRYDNYRQIRFYSSNEDQLEALTGSNAWPRHFDFWTRPIPSGFATDALVSPTLLPAISDLIKKRSLNATILVEDAQKLIGDQTSHRKPRTMSDNMDIDSFLTDFQSYDTISAFVDKLARQYPSLASIEVIGKSYEGRDLKMINVGAKGGRKRKPLIVVGAGLHAREWAGPPAAVYVAWSLLSKYNTSAKAKLLLDAFEFHILPLSNPDGYEYSRLYDRMWIKTRSINTGSKCLGVNANRNWAFHWGEGATVKGSKVSRDPCNENYCGPNAYSEIETHIFSNRMALAKNQIKLYVSFHGDHQKWYTPWSYKLKEPRNIKSLTKVAKIGAKALSQKYGTKYTVGSGAKTYGIATGEAADWALGDIGVPYTYTLGLGRTSSPSTFIFPKSQIKPIAVETCDGLAAAALALLEEHRNDNLRNLKTGCRC